MGTQLPLPQRGTAPTQFSAHICCGQMAAYIKMSLGMELSLGPGDFVLDGDPAPPPQKGGKFSAHVYCGQPAGWMKLVLGMVVGLSPGDFVLDVFSAHFYCGQTAIKIPLGMDVGLSPGDFVLDGDPVPSPKRGRSPQIFRTWHSRYIFVQVQALVLYAF